MAHPSGIDRRAVGYALGMETDLIEELLELERSGWESLCDGTGSDFYGTLMTDDGLMVLANGKVMSREEVIAALAQSPAWASFEISNARTLELQSDVAALVYVGTGRRDGADDFVGVMTSVYRRSADGWELALYQQTPAAG